MATTLYLTDNYRAASLRGGGVSLMSRRTGQDVFFQPGDDAAEVHNTIAALEELPEAKRDAVFDMVASQYV